METVERATAKAPSTPVRVSGRIAWLREHPTTTATVLLALVAIIALLLYGLTLRTPRPIDWDEAVYLTQVMPDEPAAPLDAHRARGVSLIAAPVAVFGASMPVVRVWLVVVSSIGLFVAFRPWIRTIGLAAPLAALLFAGNWAVRSFATELWPNYWTALGFVAAAAHVAAYMGDAERRDLFAVAAWIAFTGLMRPSDAVLVAAGLFVATLLMRPRLIVAVTMALAIGGLIGVGAWFVEGYVRFGSGIERLTNASEGVTGGVPANNVMVYANNLEGPARCVQDCKRSFNKNPRWNLSVSSWAMTLVIATSMALAMIRPRRSRIPAAVYVAAVAAIPPLYFYLTCNCAINARYMLPPYGLVAVCVAAGVVGGLRMMPSLPRALSAYVLIPAALVAWLIWQTDLAQAYVKGVGRTNPPVIAEALDEHAAGRPCAAAVEWEFWQIQYYSDCLVVPLHKGKFLQPPVSSSLTEYDLRELAEDGYQIYVVSRTPRLSDESAVHQKDWTGWKINTPGRTFKEFWLFSAASPQDVPSAPAALP